MQNRSHAPRAAIIGAFLIIYIVWGSTYLGIQIAIETIPPFAMASLRFLIAGSVLLAWARWQGAPWPSWPRMRSALILGVLFLALGNGGVVWAEQRVASGLTSLLVAVTPIWTALFQWRLQRSAPTSGVISGLLLGFIGTGLLIAPGEFGGGAVDTAGALALMLASVSWSTATVLSPRMALPESLPMTSSLEMLSGGVVLAFVALVTGEWQTFAPSAVSNASLWSLAYLIVFGSLVAFSAFAWLLRVSTPERVSTCAYVNPAVAVALGWLVAGEFLNPRSLVAGVLILAAVALIVSKKRS